MDDQGLDLSVAIELARPVRLGSGFGQTDAISDQQVVLHGSEEHPVGLASSEAGAVRHP